MLIASLNVWKVPAVVIRKVFFQQSGQHATQVVLFVLVEVTFFEHLVLALQPIIGVDSNSETVGTVEPDPSLNEAHVNNV